MGKCSTAHLWDGLWGISHLPEKCFGCEASMLQEWVIRGSRTGARGSTKHLLGGAGDLESAKALPLYFTVG